MKKAVSLYVHIPFCKRKCDYCDFFSKPFSCVPDEYIAAVLNEAAYYVRVYDIQSWNTIYIGGGTPSLLHPGQLERLVTGIRSACGSDAAAPCEITVEMNPDDITESLLAAAEQAGVSRLSVGIQSLDDSVLSAVHRRCTVKTSCEALACIHRIWKKHFSADMISGLPGLKNGSFVQGLKKLISYGPDHISLYSLTVESGTPLSEALNAGRLLYDQDTADEQWIQGRDFLEKKGFAQYEVSNFARPGFESRHNMAYWRQEDYIGIGSGATGTVYNTGSAAAAGVRWTNTEDICRYTDFWTDCQVKDTELPRTVEMLDRTTQEFEFLMMGLRTRAGVSAETYLSRFGSDLAQRIGASSAGGLFYTWQSKGLAECIQSGSSTRFALTREGLLFLNSFLESLPEL